MTDIMNLKVSTFICIAEKNKNKNENITMQVVSCLHNLLSKLKQDRPNCFIGLQNWDYQILTEDSDDKEIEVYEFEFHITDLTEAEERRLVELMQEEFPGFELMK